MALKDRKITEAGIAQHGVISAPDRLTGTAAENKKVFDKLVRNVVAKQLNGLVDDLAGSGGAGEIGASPINGLDGDNVQQMLAAMKAVLDKRINEAGVAAFNGRSGPVMPQSGDYTAAMVGAAPAGYGLGEPFAIRATDTVTIDEALDKALATMKDTTTALVAVYDPAVTTRNMFGLLSKHANNYGVLVVHNHNGIGVNTLTKKKEAGVWQPWEWENPHMVLGEEYRTTERYLGKPVYVATVDFGTLPASTSRGELHGIANIDKVFHCSAMIVDKDGNLVGQAPAQLGAFDNQLVTCSANKYYFSMTTLNNDWYNAGIKAVGYMKYTKTTG